MITEYYKRSYQMGVFGDQELALAVGIIRRAFAPVAARFGLTQENCPGNGAFITEERLRRSLSGKARLFAVYHAGIAAGCIIAKRKDREAWYLEKAAVLPEFRRRGLGSALLDAAQAYIMEEGGLRIRIGIIAANDELRLWYEKAGFLVTGLKDFPTLPFTVCYMKKTLGQKGPVDRVRAC